MVIGHRISAYGDTNFQPVAVVYEVTPIELVVINFYQTSAILRELVRGQAMQFSTFSKMIKCKIASLIAST